MRYGHLVASAGADVLVPPAPAATPPPAPPPLPLAPPPLPLPDATDPATPPPPGRPARAASSPKRSSTADFSAADILRQEILVKRFRDDDVSTCRWISHTQQSHHLLFITSMQFYAQDRSIDVEKEITILTSRRWRTDRRTDTHTHKQAGRQAGGQADKQGGRGAGRQSPGEWDYQCLEANHVFSVHYTTGLASV